MRWPLVLTLVALVATTATAHETDPNVVTRIDAVTPALPGVTVVVRAGVADQLYVTNTTRHPVEVLDRDGAPFLRIGPDTVRADVASPDWQPSNSPFGTALTPASGPKDDWRVVARGNAWGWFDHRMHQQPQRSPAARAVTRLYDWTIPLRHDGAEHVVHGHAEYRPVLGGFRTRVARTPAGVALDPLDGRIPGLYLRWQGSGTLVVRGVQGEPFARFTKDGVEVNDASATWQDDQRLRGQTPATPADPATPVWRDAGVVPSLTWLDRRLAYTPGAPPEDALRSSRPTTVVEWDIAVDVDGVRGHLQGVTTWVPNDAGGDTGRPWLPLGAAVLVAAGAAVALRVRARER